MAAVSSISAMKVDTPLSWQSPAPTRAKIQSLMAMCASSQGTKQPTCAINTFTPTCSHAVVVSQADREVEGGSQAVAVSRLSIIGLCLHICTRDLSCLTSLHWASCLFWPWTDKEAGLSINADAAYRSRAVQNMIRRAQHLIRWCGPTCSHEEASTDSVHVAWHCVSS